MNQTSHSKGQHAERACCEFLQQQGLKLLARNYRGRHGEIDIIMQDKDALVFVEVRYRKNNHYGGALESVTAGKQARIQAIASASQATVAVFSPGGAGGPGPSG